MLVSSFFFLKNNYKTKKIYLSCHASKWQFPLALTEFPLVNTSGRVQFSSPVLSTGSMKEDPARHDLKIVDWNVKKH